MDKGSFIIKRTANNHLTSAFHGPIRPAALPGMIKETPHLVERELWVENRLGIHARPASQILNLAMQFKSEIILEKDGCAANAREILALLALDCPQGTRLVVRAKGVDARDAAQAMVQLFARKFGET